MAQVRLTPEVVKQRAIGLLERRMHVGMQIAVRQTKVLLNKGGGSRHEASEEGEPPRKQSSQLFQSIAYIVRRSADKVTGVFGSGKVYARRLEMGFVGTDSLGRKYHQLPRPYIRRAWYDVKAQVLSMLISEKKAT